MNDDFINFCVHDRESGLNSVGTYVHIIKIFLKKAKEKGYEVCNELSEFATTKKNSLSVALSEDEIERLFNFDFSQNK